MRSRPAANLVCRGGVGHPERIARRRQLCELPPGRQRGLDELGIQRILRRVVL